MQENQHECAVKEASGYFEVEENNMIATDIYR